MFAHFNPDLEYYILSFLNARDLCHASEVNKEWNKKAFDNRIWALFYNNISIANNITIKSYYNTNGVISINGLLREIIKFSQKIGSQENGKFICYFPKNTNSYIKVQLCNKQPKHFLENEHHFHVEEQRWFFQTFPFQGPYTDKIVVAKNHKYMIHIRIPENLNVKNIINRIIGILNCHESSILPAAIRPASRNFKTCTWF
ncbi:MAG TPA: hypothetical protein PLC42_02900 [Parachlamydiaceae bacterium]|nr:hypothetical protein [Parachlamydiaceae bacterium]